MTEKTGLSKRELNKARKRADIVRIASGIFLEQGYAATTMSGIADAVGGSKATLWAHFSSKEDLFAAVVDLHVETFARDVEDVLTGQTFSIPALHRACLRFIDCLLRASSVMLYRLITSEGERFPEIKETFYIRGPVKLRCAITEFFATSFDAEQARRLTQVTMSAVTGYRSDVLLRPDPVSRDQHVDFVDTLIAHIAWPAPRERAGEPA